MTSDVKKLSNGAIVRIHYDEKGKEQRREIIARVVYASPVVEKVILGAVQDFLERNQVPTKLQIEEVPYSRPVSKKDLN